MFVNIVVMRGIFYNVWEYIDCLLDVLKLKLSVCAL